MSAAETAKAYFTKAKDTAITACGWLKDQGYYDVNNVKDFGIELVQPLKNAEGPAVEWLKAEALKTLTLKPSAPRVGFVLWNSAGFFIGCLEVVWSLLFGSGWISAIWNVGFAFACAYTFFWAMLLKQHKKLALYTIGLLAAYCIFCVFSGIANLILIVPAALYFIKATCTLLMLVNAYPLYKEIAGDPTLLPGTTP